MKVSNISKKNVTPSPYLQDWEVMSGVLESDGTRRGGVDGVGRGRSVGLLLFLSPKKGALGSSRSYLSQDPLVVG